MVGPEGDTIFKQEIPCRSELIRYTDKDGAYWRELEAVGETARRYFDSRPQAAARNSSVVVFDIDETALSNLPLLRRKDGLLNWTAWKHQAVSPAIKPILDLYLYLYKAGYSVTFITGRNEASREATELNLAAAGYGRPCTPAPESTAGGPRVNSSTPCYVELALREVGDRRLASVYKPERRARLQQRGYSIVASFGDQFSDFSGTNASDAFFKTPNPWYYIL